MNITITKDRVDIDFAGYTGRYDNDSRLAIMDKAVELSRTMGPEQDKIMLTPLELDMDSMRVGYNPNVISGGVSVNGDAGDSGRLS